MRAAHVPIGPLAPEDVTIPAPLTQPGSAGSTPEGARWLAAVPTLVTTAVQRWQLRLDRPFQMGSASWAAPGHRLDGTPVVLKISFPHDEARYEANALSMWRGSAAVELLDHHAEDWALLMRRAHPGTPLLAWNAPAEQLIDACLGVLANLHMAPIADVGIPHLSQVCASWAQVAHDRAERWHPLLGAHVRLVRYGIDLMQWFADDDSAATVLLHGDLNPGNVILDDPGTAHWLAIDPKPMLGDPAYELWPVLSQIGDPFAAPDPYAELAGRLRHAGRRLGLAPRRVAWWACARSVESVLWQLDTWPDPQHQAAALEGLEHARLWAELADAMTA